ncbi:PAS domain S-box protein [Paraburkholderia sp. MM5384-R2]|uniref:sensor histidine kinase n=1 Tax=Paraburkholderia sp. MM5384-R2 TaxID=2723097 RepID=UPI00161335E0|nr:PAS domain-containing sensor histidine kinase [Paraburkholderia sp. MM5384-R2]MBB5495978.1 PAS domain S-box-containing protein [Paraburkholderia sp. MM5384-R2]
MADCIPTVNSKTNPEIELEPYKQLSGLTHELFRQVVEAAPNAMVMADRDGRIVLVNAQTEKLFGYSRDELLGNGVDKLVPERFRSAHSGYRRTFYDDLKSRPMGIGRDLFALRKDGSEFPVEIGLNPVTTNEGVFVLAAVVDITERRRLEERFRQVVEAAPNAMVMVEREGRIVLVNAQTEKLFGYAREELFGRTIETLVPARFRAGHHGYRAAYFDDLKPRSMGTGRDLYGLRKDGSEFPVEIGLNPVRTSEEVFVLAAIVDITERKRAEQELVRRTEELARSNQDLEQFAYVASHDLQEPLRAVAGPLQLLQRRYQGQLDARADEFIAHAVDGAIRMQTLIDDLLAYSRVGRSEAARQLTECGKALDRALKSLSVGLQESGAMISRADLPTVIANPTQLTLLFQNLVGNALKFRHSDRPAQIDIDAVRQGDDWVISVKDNGIGIDPQYFERIFLIFQRLHSRVEYPGTGIGLALCKRIVGQHGGRIWVESAPGSGTTFFFTLNAKTDGRVQAQSTPQE